MEDVEEDNAVHSPLEDARARRRDFPYLAT